MERGLSEKYHDRVSPVKRHMDHMVAIGAAPGLINPQLNTMTSDVIKVREFMLILSFDKSSIHVLNKTSLASNCHEEKSPTCDALMQSFLTVLKDT